MTVGAGTVVAAVNPSWVLIELSCIIDRTLVASLAIKFRNPQATAVGGYA